MKNILIPDRIAHADIESEVFGKEYKIIAPVATTAEYCRPGL